MRLVGMSVREKTIRTIGPFILWHNLLSTSLISIQGTKRSLWHCRLRSHLRLASYSSHVLSENEEVQKSKLQVCGASSLWLHTVEAFPVTGSAFCSTRAPCSVILPRTAHYPPDLQATKNLTAHHTRWDVRLMNGWVRTKKCFSLFPLIFRIEFYVRMSVWTTQLKVKNWLCLNLNM